jgi:hypothetical protein
MFSAYFEDSHLLSVTVVSQITAGVGISAAKGWGDAVLLAELLTVVTMPAEASADQEERTDVSAAIKCVFFLPRLPFATLTERGLSTSGGASSSGSAASNPASTSNSANSSGPAAGTAKTASPTVTAAPPATTKSSTSTSSGGSKSGARQDSDVTMQLRGSPTADGNEQSLLVHLDRVTKEGLVQNSVGDPLVDRAIAMGYFNVNYGKFADAIDLFSKLLESNRAVKGAYLGRGTGTFDTRFYGHTPKFIAHFDESDLRR